VTRDKIKNTSINQMTKKTTKNEKFEAEKLKRLEVAKAKLIDGSIGAISVDTCIFTANDYRLDRGVLKLLEQFKNNDFELIFSEITVKEVRNHIAKHTDDAKMKLRSALREVGKYYQEQSGKESSIIDNLLGSESVKDLTTKKLKDFCARCDAKLIQAKSSLDIDELIKMYFDVKAPFEYATEKKSEFPDAIALLSLQTWSKKQGKAVLFVTQDKGCKSFCDSSDNLYAVDSLKDALSLIQQRNVHLSTLCGALEIAINNGKYSDLVTRIENTISNDLWSIDWLPEASSSYYYEAELEELELESATFDGEQPDFSVVDYRDDMLVVQVSMQVKVKASCDFTFSVKDGFDHDMVHIGSAYIRKTKAVKVDVLLTFDEPSLEIPEIVDIELVYSRRTIDFGSVEPDYRDEDPDGEYYQ
jgi:hypothetical protein